jgi:hypothetical protein
MRLKLLWTCIDQARRGVEEVSGAQMRLKRLVAAGGCVTVKVEEVSGAQMRLKSIISLQWHFFLKRES